jgi:hypothetical protein
MHSVCSKLLALLLTLAFGAGPSASMSAGTEAAKGSALFKPQVTFGTVFKVAGEPNPLYRVSYTYDFPGRSQVFIRGVGTVRSKGSLSYLQNGETIEFLDESKQDTLYVAKIEHPVTLMGARAPVIPDETQFPRESRRGRWRGEGPFAEKAFGVLEQHFRSGYRAFEKDASVFYLTSYAEVPPHDDSTRTQVSILISYPAMSDAHDVSFTVAFTSQERRSRTDWRDASSESSKKATEAFVDSLLDALQR